MNRLNSKGCLWNIKLFFIAQLASVPLYIYFASDLDSDSEVFLFYVILMVIIWLIFLTNPFTENLFVLSGKNKTIPSIGILALTIILFFGFKLPVMNLKIGILVLIIFNFIVMMIKRIKNSRSLHLW